MSDKSSLAKRLIKDLVLPKSNEVDENLKDKNLKAEPVSDGYVIVSFSNRKKAKIQTATFSDVSKSSTDALNILKNQNGTEDSNIPEEDSFYGEAFWIGSEDEEENEDTRHGGAVAQQQSQRAESDMSSAKDDSDSIASVVGPQRRMSRLTALSRGLLPCEDAGGTAQRRGGRLKSMSSASCSAFSDGRSAFYGGGGSQHQSSAVCNGSGGAHEDGRKMLRCRECGKHYRNEYSLRHHICLRRKEVWKKGDVPKQLVDGQLIYFCPSCAKPFRWMGNLTRHFYVHTGQRFFRCGLCDKEFFSAYQVRRHMNSHTGQRYKCRVCDKPFTCVYACTWHMRQHSQSSMAAVSPDSLGTSGSAPSLSGPTSHNLSTNHSQQQQQQSSSSIGGLSSLAAVAAAEMSSPAGSSGPSNDAAIHSSIVPSTAAAATEVKCSSSHKPEPRGPDDGQSSGSH